MRAGKENGFLLPNSVGTSGQVLTSNGSGVLSWSTPLSLQGDAGDLLFNNGGTIGASAFVNSENGYLKLITGLPNISNSGGVVMGSKDMGGRIMPAWVGPMGLDSTAQANLGFNRIVQIVPVAGSTTPTIIGQSITATGTATARTPATTNYFTSLSRLGFVGSANLTGSISGYRTGTQWWRGGGISNAGGFFFTCTFALTNSAAQASGRAFVGLYASTAAIATGGVEPTTLTNAIGIARSVNSNNWMIYGANGTANSTLVDLGSNFPAGTINTDFFRLVLFAPPGGNFVGWKVTRLNAIDSTTSQPYTASGTITNTALMPVNTAFLAAYGWSSTGTLNGTSGIDLIGLYVETDN